MAGGLNTYDYAANNSMRFTDILGLAVIYGNYVITNPTVRAVLSRLDRGLPGSDIVVTGGDRYIDKDGNIRSSSNHEIVPRSSKNTTHAMNLAVDFVISNMTPTEELLLEYFDWVKFYKGHFKDGKFIMGHIHGDLRKEGRFCPTPKDR